MNILFLDDNKKRHDQFRAQVPYAKFVVDAQEAIESLPNKDWDIVFLDHDLGGEEHVDSSRADCGMEVVRWICCNQPSIKLVVVHTNNNIAGPDMACCLRCFGYKANDISAWKLFNEGALEKLLAEFE